MKSLTELINEVKNNVKNTSARYSSLVKLGLRPVEVTEIINAWRQEEREERLRAAVKYTFGIELEVVGVTNRARMISEAGDRGLSINYEAYNHADNDRYFKFVTDGSLYGDGAIECVSPILDEGAYGDQAIQGICEALQGAGASVNSSCGYHVHVGGPITDRQYVNVFKNYQKLEADIDLHMAPSRRSSQWCRSIAGFDYSACSCPPDVRAVQHCNRYHKVNAEAWWRHRTIEFRQHQGTVNAKKVQMWAAFCIKLVAWSRDHVLSEATTIAQAPFLTATEKRWWAGRKAAFARPVEEMAF